MSTFQWVLVIELAPMALAALVGLFARGRA